MVAIIAHRYVLGIAVAGLLLAACSALPLSSSKGQDETRPLTGARGAMPQSPRVRAGDLLYAAGADGNVYVYSYPALKRQYEIKQPSNAGAYGECTDAVGDVFVTTRNLDSYAGTIYEYRYGSKTPVSVLSDPGEPWGCAVDPNTGDLAVSNFFDHNNTKYENLGEIVIYPKAGGPPKRFAHSAIYRMYFCGYDPNGNLFVLTLAGINETVQLYELPRGGQQLNAISLSTSIVTPGAVQWNEQHLTITDLNQGKTPGPELVDELKLRGGTATVIRTRELHTSGNWHAGQTLIDGGNVLAIPFYPSGKRIGKSKVSMWTYPSGPARAYRSTPLNNRSLFGLAISAGT